MLAYIRPEKQSYTGVLCTIFVLCIRNGSHNSFFYFVRRMPFELTLVLSMVTCSSPAAADLDDAFCELVIFL
jgi:hypothetical protein